MVLKEQLLSCTEVELCAGHCSKALHSNITTLWIRYYQICSWMNSLGHESSNTLPNTTQRLQVQTESHWTTSLCCDCCRTWGLSECLCLEAPSGRRAVCTHFILSCIQLIRMQQSTWFSKGGSPEIKLHWPAEVWVTIQNLAIIFTKAKPLFRMSRQWNMYADKVTCKC